MLKQSYLLSLLAGFLLVFSSCSDDDSDPAPKVDANQLKNHEWVMTEHVVKATGEEDYDVLADYEDSEVSIVFDGEGEYTIKVDGDDYLGGTYEVQNGKLAWDCPISVIGQTLGGDDTEFTISELNNNTLKLTYSVTMSGMTITENMTMKAK